MLFGAVHVQKLAIQRHDAIPGLGRAVVPRYAIDKRVVVRRAVGPLVLVVCRVPAQPGPNPPKSVGKLGQNGVAADLVQERRVLHVTGVSARVFAACKRCSTHLAVTQLYTRGCSP